ncbi:MAG: SDR family oxidoreductase [Deltaproteobacteria bacterium]|nr:MAG: SDR family oxidoreductase [Deltaproteobacteria bacterium]
MSPRPANPFGPRGWTPDRIGDLRHKTYVVTGGNDGAGFHASRILLAKGARVVMANRNPDKSRAAIAALKDAMGPDVPVSFVRMDLASLASVREAAEGLRASTPRIDALVCNAAIAQVPRRTLTEDGFESHLGVNHLGHFLLCALLFDRIAAASGRVVAVGSNAYKMGPRRLRFEDLDFAHGYSGWDAYAQSKLAQTMFGFELDRRCRDANVPVRAFVCHPGASRTGLIAKNGGLRDRIVWGLLAPLVAQSAERGAWPEVMCATEPDLAPKTLYGPTKRMDTVGPVGPCPLDPIALDREAAAHLWSISEERVGVRWTPGRPPRPVDGSATVDGAFPDGAHAPHRGFEATSAPDHPAEVPS